MSSVVWSEVAAEPQGEGDAVSGQHDVVAVAAKMFHKVAPAYGEICFFEVTRDHAQKVHENQFLHRLNMSDPTSFGPMPSFDPLPPVIE